MSRFGLPTSLFLIKLIFLVIVIKHRMGETTVYVFQIEFSVAAQVCLELISIIISLNACNADRINTQRRIQNLSIQVSQSQVAVSLR